MFDSVCCSVVELSHVPQYAGGMVGPRRASFSEGAAEERENTPVGYYALRGDRQAMHSVTPTDDYQH